MRHLERTVEGNTGFAIALFKELLRQDAGANVFVSPWSIASVLAVAYNGATGQTARAMAHVLGWEAMAVEEVNRAFAEITAGMLHGDPDVQLTVANALWAAADVGLLPEFVAVAQDVYRAEAREATLSDPAVLGEINAWVRAQTGGQIEHILDGLDTVMMLVLVNAIYFAGRWTDRFDPGQTRSRDFTLEDGRKKRHAMMDGWGKHHYLDAADVQAVRLPYGGGRLAMYILLPRKGTTLDAFVATLSASRWSAWLAEMEERQGRVVLPRFRIEYRADVSRALAALGMASAFERDAEFDGLARVSLWIDRVEHRAVVDVDEEGTVAAAATAVTFRGMALGAPPPFQMVVDRPFVCAIRDETGAILFLGAIRDPSAPNMVRK